MKSKVMVGKNQIEKGMNPKPAILYIDDEVDNLTSFKYQFQNFYEIFTAESAGEGYKLLKQNDINLVIADQRMPKMTGTEFFEEILTEYPDTIKIILTGFSDIEAIIDGINKAKIYYYLQKPWKEEEIKLIIDNGLESVNLIRKNEQLIEDLRETDKKLSKQTKKLEEEIIEHEKYLRDAEKRVKELNCLYRSSDTISRYKDLEKILKNVVNLIPSGWQYPEITKARIRFDVKDYVSETFQESMWNLSTDIIIQNECRGSVTVFYLEERPELDEGPFMKDERNLINAMAKIISRAIESNQDGVELKKHREHLEELVKKRTTELEEKNVELKRFYNATIDREFRMKELKDEIDELKKQIGHKNKHGYHDSN